MNKKNNLLISIDEYHARAKKLLKKSAFDYADGGAGTEFALKSERESLEKIRLISRVLTGNKSIDPSVNILGQKHRLPILIAPTAYHGLFNADGELATVRASKAFDCGMVLSTMSTTKMETISKNGSDKMWFQLYVYRDRKITEALLKRVEKAGFKAIVLTVDLPVMGIRYRDLKNNFKLPKGVVAANALPFLNEQVDVPLGQFVTEQLEPSLSWNDISWIRSISSLPIILKGILNPRDALRAKREGLQGIVVSSHGARQLDSLVSPIDILPSVRKAVGDSFLVMADGGIRNGGDIVRFLCSGASAVLIGRPVIWGLSVDGTNGVLSVLSLLERELLNHMHILGVGKINQFDESFIFK
jgi:isopentenyl diphosphate isomerase/L-lactate dehydrogenase-like FMN-dependent dehydrogenase